MTDKPQTLTHFDYGVRYKYDTVIINNVVFYIILN